MNVEQFKLEGADEIINAISGLSEKMTFKFLYDFNRKAAKKYVTDALTAGTPYATNIKRYYATLPDARSKNKTAVWAGPAASVFWVRYLEKGTVQRKTKKGYNRGLIKANPQIIPIVENSVDPIIEFTREELGNEINKMLLRKIKKLKK